MPKNKNEWINLISVLPKEILLIILFIVAMQSNNISCYFVDSTCDKTFDVLIRMEDKLDVVSDDISDIGYRVKDNERDIIVITAEHVKIKKILEK